MNIQVSRDCKEVPSFKRSRQQSSRTPSSNTKHKPQNSHAPSARPANAKHKTCLSREVSQFVIPASSDSEGIRRFLHKAFAVELRRSRQHGHFHACLELYAGSGGVSRALRSCGWGCLGFELGNGAPFDLLNPTVRSVVRGWILGGSVAGVFLGTPCSSWSLARRGPPGSHWGPLRSKERPMGLENLSEADLKKVAVGNEGG